MRKIAAAAVLASVTSVTVAILAIVINFASDISDHNYVVAGRWIMERRYAMAKKNQLKEKKIVIRVDDVQQGYLNEVSRRMIVDAAEREMKLVLGVIPRNFSEDKEMVSFLKEYFGSVEIAVHGWKHSVDGNYNMPEFGEVDYVDAVRMLADAKREFSVFPEWKAYTFIPPQNEISREGRRALVDVGYRVLSSDGKARNDKTTSTYDWSARKLADPKAVAAECGKALEVRGICVIMTHPQDYATSHKFDAEKYISYIELLNQIELLDASVTTFAEIYGDGR